MQYLDKARHLRHLDKARHLRHHAFAIEAEAEAGIKEALAWAERELNMQVQRNPDVVIVRYGLLSVADARSIIETASSMPVAGAHKIIVMAASRAYHEAQNALLKLFEEPPEGVYLFLVVPSLGTLLPTLRSRVQTLEDTEGSKQKTNIPEIAEEFLKASREKRSAMIKKIVAHQSGDAALAREEALAIANGVEAIAYQKFQKQRHGEAVTLLSDIAVLRGYLYDRSAPVRMILEHLSLVIPNGLL